MIFNRNPNEHYYTNPETGRIKVPYMICPNCGIQILAEPEVELFIGYIPKFGFTQTPVLSIQKHIPLNKVNKNPLLKKNLQNFLIKIEYKQPFFVTIPRTKTSNVVLQKMREINIIP